MKLAARRAFVNSLARCILNPQKVPRVRSLSRTAALRNCVSEVAFRTGVSLLYPELHGLKTVRLTAHPSGAAILEAAGNATNAVEPPAVCSGMKSIPQN